MPSAPYQPTAPNAAPPTPSSAANFNHLAGFFRHPVRGIVRLFRLFGALIRGALAFRRGLRGVAAADEMRARKDCLQQTGRLVLGALGVEVRVRGTPPPRQGLLVCNHLSYLDIPAICSVAQAQFVSKLEVKSWPVFGWFATAGATIYVNREKRSEVGRLSTEIKERLDQGALVVLFPEGTSSDGREVLPFKSSLLEPAVGSRHPIHTAHLRYRFEDGTGDPGQEICYWGGMTFGPHLLNLLTKGHIIAELTFGQPGELPADRKLLAKMLQSEVTRLGSSAGS